MLKSERKESIKKSKFQFVLLIVRRWVFCWDKKDFLTSTASNLKKTTTVLK